MEWIIQRVICITYVAFPLPQYRYVINLTLLEFPRDRQTERERERERDRTNNRTLEL
jgi:hypothetical protein